jgi:RloB-like protein
MPRRDRLARRRPAVREPLVRLLVVCGAEKTEQAYLEGARNSRKATSVDIRIVERVRAPDQVVEYARDHCGYQDFDETWCVLDVDRFEVEGGRVTKAGEVAKGAAIHLAISNPCFEYWLLLHHTYTDAPFTRCDEVTGRIRKFLPDYDKTDLRFRDFADGVDDAIKRAKQREPSGTAYLSNPSSGVWALMERLMGQES